MRDHSLAAIRRALKQAGFTEVQQLPAARSGNTCFGFADAQPAAVCDIFGRPVAHDSQREMLVYVSGELDMAIRVDVATSRVVVCRASTYGARMVRSVDPSKLGKLERILKRSTASNLTSRTKTPNPKPAKQIFQPGVGAYRAAAKAAGYTVRKDAETGVLTAFNEANRIVGRYFPHKAKNPGWLK